MLCPARVFIHRSNKTRIETNLMEILNLIMQVFLYIDPIKQGLKRWNIKINKYFIFVFIHRSNKTRIET